MLEELKQFMVDILNKSIASDTHQVIRFRQPLIDHLIQMKIQEI